MTAVAELDNLIQFLEADIPANPNSPKNQRKKRGLERELRKYFRSLEDAFPYQEIARLYDTFVKESLGSESKDILDPLLATFSDELVFALNGFLAEVYISGSAEMVTWGHTQAGIPIAFEGPPIEQAITWAEKHSATLVTQINEETRRRLAQVVSDGVKNKRGVPGLARDIRSSFGNMTKHRSELIARTETANALSQASLDTMKDMGIDGKEWVTVGDDRVSPECRGNEAEGIIPTDQPFSSGRMAPPEHPACRCSLAPASLKR